MNILLTGASGFIGRSLMKRLSDHHHRVICLSRRPVAGSGDFIQGSFDSMEDLQKLNAYPLDVVVHLAAVTGGCSEEEGLAVNVLGTRRLYRYLLDRGCPKFMTASSIAAAGGLTPSFIPLELPISDDHPCLAADAYGLSKGMVEELTRYFYRRHSDRQFINLRLGAVAGEDWKPPVIESGRELAVPFIALAHIYASDVVEGIARAAEAPLKPGVANYNLVGPDLTCNLPAGKVLNDILPAGHPLSFYFPGNEYKPLYAMDRFVREFGFTPERSTRPAY